MSTKFLDEPFKLTRAEILGKYGEENVGMKLSELFGFRNVSVGINGHSLGKDGYPDIKLVYDNNVFFVEVKSICPFVKRNRVNKETGLTELIGYRPNAVKVNRYSWNRLFSRAKTAIATIIVIIELRLNLGENDYFIIDSDTVQDFIDKSNVEWIHIPLQYIMDKSKKLEFNKSEFIINTVETTQKRLNL